jgi:nitroreductase
MHNILNLLKSHRSIRKYKDQPIPDELLNDILTSARQAPTSSNLQAYSIIVVKNQEKKKRLAELCGNQKWVKQCPVFIAMCPDLYRLEKVCWSRKYEINNKYIELFIVAVVDTALVAQNILVAAESSGLGVCMIGGIRNNPDGVCELLKLPQKVFPLMGICLGYPDQEGMVKPRMLSEMVVHHEEYNDNNFESLLAEYDKIIQATGLYRGPNRKVASPDGREIPDDFYSWSEHSSRRAASKDLKALRAHLKEFLDKRGFNFD